MLQGRSHVSSAMSKMQKCRHVHVYMYMYMYMSLHVMQRDSLRRACSACAGFNWLKSGLCSQLQLRKMLYIPAPLIMQTPLEEILQVRSDTLILCRRCLVTQSLLADFPSHLHWPCFTPDVHAQFA